MFITRSMTHNVVTIGPDAGIVEARELMKAHHIRHLPVVEGDRVLIGIVTDRDIRSALPSAFLDDEETRKEREGALRLKIRDIMTKDPVTISASSTLEDAMLLIQQMRVGAMPVMDRHQKLVGMISIRDILRAFINVLGLEEPGTLLCIVVENKVGQMKRIVDAITEERVSFGSILVARYWDEGKRAVFPYLLTHNVTHVKKKLEKMGYTLLDPMDWALEHPPKTD